MLKGLLKIFFLGFLVMIIVMGFLIVKNKFKDDIEETQINYTSLYNNCMIEQNTIKESKDKEIKAMQLKIEEIEDVTLIKCTNTTKIVYNTIQNNTCSSITTNRENETMQRLIRHIELLEEVNEDCYYSNDIERYKDLQDNLTDCKNILSDIKDLT